MSQCVIKNLPLLKILVSSPPKLRRKILETGSLQLIKAIVECIENVLKGNIAIEESELKKLKKHKSTLRAVSKAPNKLSQKKKVIIQKGGAFLPALLIPVITVLAEKLLQKL